ncbi:hypothetical protein [Colwellia sp. UCD-KL20]|uniref:hypothetical protein n=1 Tax=Colwellia sp. UCD-KL20 TaxID=1917165 RepID=UPI0009709D40|nr:hypothetical protein [Colwellia sp. UCD-KL20]
MKTLPLPLFLLLIVFPAISKNNINELVCSAHTNVEAKKKCYSDFGISIPEGALKPENMRKVTPQNNPKKALPLKNTSKPQRYIGMAIDKAAMFFDVKPNLVNNIIFDNYDFHVLLESSDGISVSFVQVLFKKYKNCSTQKPVPANFLYEKLDINVNNLVLLKERNPSFYFSSYLDPLNNIKTSAYCVSNNDFFVVTFVRNRN